MISGWWLTYPSDEYEFVSWGLLFSIYGKITNVPNHQPDMLYRVDDVVIYSMAGGKTSACTWLPSGELT